MANVASALGADVAGVNCSLGPQSALEVVEQMAANTSIRLSAMPNAGLPKFMDGRLVYPVDAGVLRRVREASSSQAGANIVGGCCGTTPEHIAAMRETLDREWNRRGRATPATQAAAGA